MAITIKNRYGNSVLFTSETATTIAEAVKEAVKSRADLSRAYLSGSNLSGAYLPDAYLYCADLSGANLSRADLSGANLSRADLSRADLSRADLSRADLSGADLSGADLSLADLSGADLSGADLSGADLSLADLSGADLSGAINAPINPSEKAKKAPYTPIIPRIHSAILEAVTAKGCSLDMAHWHTCETTHCRAGWVVHLAGEAGKALEKEIGTARAARAIYRKSDPGFRAPWFNDTDERAMADIVRCAELEAEFGTAAKKT